MAGKRISRRKLAAFVADKLVAGAPARDMMAQVAAYLIETRQTHDVELLVRDIEAELMSRGIVVADVTAAHPLTDEIKDAVASLLEAKDLQIRETVDPFVLGGISVNVSGKRYDATLRRKINLLKSTER